MNATVQKTNESLFADSAALLLAILDARSKDIISRRYGIDSGSVETLDSIGKEYGITRERVRQIEAQAKKILARRQDVLENVAQALSLIFESQGGILSVDHLMKIMAESFETAPQQTVVTFFLDILPAYEYSTRAKHFGSHWIHPDLVTEHSEAVINIASSLLKESGEPVSEPQLLSLIREKIGASATELPDAHIFALLTASNKLKRTVFGEWGLAQWVETSPRGVGDKAYIVMRRHGNPAHFREITELINDVKFDHKRAHEQTVHNELIKDGRFVLVGRGLYGLTDWGYIPGTVADVLAAILSESKSPMSREELLDKVLEQRMVKKTTVLLGLQNNKRFERVADNSYQLAR